MSKGVDMRSKFYAAAIALAVIITPTMSHAQADALMTLRVEPQVAHDINKLTMTAGGQLLWNGIAVSEPQLATLLQTAAQMRPEPLLHLRPQPKTPYERSAKVLRMIKASGVSRLGFVGNELSSKFDKEGD